MWERIVKVGSSSEPRHLEDRIYHGLKGWWPKGQPTWGWEELHSEIKRPAVWCLSEVLSMPPAWTCSSGERPVAWVENTCSGVLSVWTVMEVIRTWHEWRFRNEKRSSKRWERQWGTRRKMKRPVSWKASEESTWKVEMTGNCIIYYRKKSHMNVFVSRDRKYGVT